MRRPFIAAVTFLGGAYFLFEFLLPARAPGWLGGWENPLSRYLLLASNLVIILGTMAFLLGPINLVRSNLTTVMKKRKDWIGSIVFLVCLPLGIAAQIGYDRNAARVGSEQAAPQQQETTAATATEPAGAQAETSPAHPPTAASAKQAQTTVEAGSAASAKPLGVQFYNLLFYGLVFSFGAASMALLALYLVSAAFRSFRFQNLDSAVMMIAATIVLIGLAPLTDLLTHWLPRMLQPNSWALWILNVPNTAVQRAVAIGVCAGAFAVGVRHWLSIGTRTE
jgi:hypothetical protein